MQVSDFDFDLPGELIAQEPRPARDAARLLRVNRRTGQSSHAAMTDLPRLLAPGDVVVVNNTRVFPARLLGHRVPSGGAVECLLVAPWERGEQSPSGERWEALVHPGQK